MATGYPKIFHDNRLDDATPAASTTATGYNVLNLRDWRSSSWWKPTALPATVTVDCASAKAADYCFVWGHDLFTHGCVFEVRGSTDNFAASNVLVDTITPTSNDPFLLQFISVSYRYWRIRVTTGATMPSLAIAAIGAALEVPAYFDEGFDPRGREAKGQYNRSQGGHPLGAVIEFQEWKDTLKFQLVNGGSGWTWIRDSFEPAWDAHLMHTAFGLAWDPDGHDTELMLLQSTGKFDSPHKSGMFCDLSLPVQGLVV